MLLTIVGYCSTAFLQKNFFNRPSILAKMLDNFNTLDELMVFQKPFNAFIDKQRLDINAQFNQNVSSMIIEKFGRELPELYIPVVNKLIFRYYFIWINASNAVLVEQRQQQKLAGAANSIVNNTNKMIFNKGRLFENCQKLIKKFKSKCLPDIIVFTSKHDEQSFITAPRVYNNHEREAICWRRDQQKRTLVNIFQLMHLYNEKSNDIKGLAEILTLLLDSALLEFKETSKVDNSAHVLFQMFTKIKFFDMPYKDVKTYLNLLNKLLEKSALENVDLNVNGQDFKREFIKYTTLLEDSYHALYHFKQSKAKKNLFLRVLFGCRYIELLSKARLYHEIKMFSKKEYEPILAREFEWTTEIAFLDLFSYDILQSQVDQGAIPFDSENIKATMLSDEIGAIVDSLVKQRCYALALDLNKRVKEIFERNYDLERI